MVPRPFWIARLLDGWRRAPVVWLTGPRRLGKTVLAQSLPRAHYLNCDLPAVSARLADPEAFYRAVRDPIVILDEVHQLPDPSRLLKIGADTFPRLKILATGSSTLAATKKFRDSLTGRKRTVELVPVLFSELPAFGVADIRDRLRLGGLPPVLLGQREPDEFFPEWIDSYFARDVQELFRLEKRAGFLAVLELLMRQSGGLLDVSRLARDSGISRPTIVNWLNVYEVTHTIHVLRPFAGGGRRELTAQPKVYGFDTGLVCHARGWDRLRQDDYGPLWEHVVFETLIASGAPRVHFWRDKQHREVDFVIPRHRGVVDAIECKWQPSVDTLPGLNALRERYPKGVNYIVSPIDGPPYAGTAGRLPVTFLSPTDLLHSGGASPGS
jgi:hypothetical protein